MHNINEIVINYILDNILFSLNYGNLETIICSTILNRKNAALFTNFMYDFIPQIENRNLNENNLVLYVFLFFKQHHQQKLFILYLYETFTKIIKIIEKVL